MAEITSELKSVAGFPLLDQPSSCCTWSLSVSGSVVYLRLYICDLYWYSGIFVGFSHICALFFVGVKI